ncbi:MAG: hypothetical protein EPN79_15980 [Burkholderiaceae bacterium]|nr:MAG: hypothetical protein EPN79_15980 [Burkholderiaceae bacterium]
MAIKRFGVVRFDSDDANYGGWASVDGQPGYRIGSVGSLDNDTLWYTNLTFQAMHQCNLTRMPFIKRTTYLNSWLQEGQADVCRNWGLLRRNHTEQAITEALSQIFGNVMRHVAAHYDLDLRAVPMYDNLADQIRARLYPEKDPHLSPEVDAALGAAHQYYTYCITPRMPEEEYVEVRFSVPGVMYAREIVDTIIPTDQVEYISGAQLPPPEQRLQWVLEQARPAMVQVTVSDVHPDVASVVAFGNGARGGSNRSWVTHPELLLLANYADVQIHSAFLFSEYERLPPHVGLPAFSRLQAMTPSAELIASNHWIGLSRENPYRLETQRDGRAHSPRATWITAYDRFLMFTHALKLHRYGLAVKRFGAGAVTVIVPKHNYRDAYELATASGLLAPPNIFNDIEIQEDLQSYG